MDANGRMSGDRGYDPSTEQGSGSNLDANGYAPGDRMYDDGWDGGSGSSSGGGKIGRPLKPEAQWLLDHPPQEMAPVDFTNAPSWWGKYPGGRNDPNAGGKIGSGNRNRGWFDRIGNSNEPSQSPVDSAMPDYGNIAPAPSTGSRMIDYIGDVGGRTGVISVSPMGAALRAAADGGGESNG